MATSVMYDNQPITVGNDFQVNATLLTDGAPTDVTSATLTASFWVAGTKLITAHAVTIVTAASGIVRISVTAAENVLVQGTCVFDIKCAFSGGVVRHFGPGQFTVRTALT